MFDEEVIANVRTNADLLNDIEGQRKRVYNRLDHLTRTEPDSDGEVRGLGYRENLAVRTLNEYLGELKKQEVQMTRGLERAIKQHPLAPWIEAQHGIGKKGIGRLLAVIIDPSWHKDGRPRTLPELFAYCGQVPGQRRTWDPRASEEQNEERLRHWSPEAKMRLYLVAVQIVKQLKEECKAYDDAGAYRVEHVDACQCGGYRRLYDARRRDTATKVHSEICLPCGPKGKPALKGSPWPPKHQHTDALRYVGKRILRDLWREARAVNGFADEANVA